MLKQLLALSLASTVALSPSLAFGADNEKMQEFESVETVEQLSVIPANVTFIPADSPQGEALRTIATPYISDPSGWDSRGKYRGTVLTGNQYSVIPAEAGVNWRSAGGNFKVDFTDVQGAFTVQLMEYDPGTGNDSIVGHELRVNGNGTLLAEGISGSVDGDNDEAEFYVSITQGYAPETIYGEGFD